MKKAHITCPYCHAPAQLRPASSIYGIHTKDRTAKLYVCSRYPTCDAYLVAMCKMLEFQMSARVLKQLSAFELKAWLGITPVSYTHLDVYKRQIIGRYTELPVSAMIPLS